MNAWIKVLTLFCLVSTTFELKIKSKLQKEHELEDRRYAKNLGYIAFSL